ncbi:MAG: glycosyltransferase [Roseburia sp.]|nr:glycosyltransferase [Roseburia sp.]
MMKSPKVSVVIPVYNGAAYVGQAIESVLRQTYGNYEIIVVNDGSNDGGMTQKAVEPFEDRVRYFEKDNGGVSSALNFGIHQMTGEYFAWLSHDDVFCETKLYDQVSLITASGDENTIAQGNYFLCNADFTEGIATDFEKYYPVEQIGNSVFLLLWGELHFSSLLFHRSHFERVGVFDETLRYAQDNDFIFRLCRNQRMIFASRPVSKVRLHTASGTNRFHGGVDAENRSVYLKVAKSLSREEIRGITDNASKLYAKLGGIINSMGGGGELKPIREHIAACKGDAMEINRLREQDLIIFGAGQYGRRLKFELDVREITVKCFVDNADEKNGQIIDDLPCYKVEHLKACPQAVVIVAQKFYAQAVEQLSVMGVSKILLKNEVDSILWKY